jgi:hypothetical protein
MTSDRSRTCGCHSWHEAWQAAHAGRASRRYEWPWPPQPRGCAAGRRRALDQARLWWEIGLTELPIAKVLNDLAARLPCGLRRAEALLGCSRPACGTAAGSPTMGTNRLDAKPTGWHHIASGLQAGVELRSRTATSALRRWVINCHRLGSPSRRLPKEPKPGPVESERTTTTRKGIARPVEASHLRCQRGGQSDGSPIRLRDRRHAGSIPHSR